MPESTRRRATMALMLLGVIGLWEVLPRTGAVPPLLLPSFSQTMAYFWSHGPELMTAVPVTLAEIAMAYVLACGLGVLAGLYVGGIPRVRREVTPWLRSAFAVPLITIYPAFMVWFGLGMGSKVAFAAVYAFIPTFLSASAGVASIDARITGLARAYGASRLQTLWLILLPASLPVAVAALRLGGAIVIVGVIVAEMLGSLSGLGALITRERTTLNSAGVYAGIVVVLGINAVHEGVLRTLGVAVSRFRVA